MCVDLARDYDVVRVDRSDSDIDLDVADYEAVRAALERCYAVVHLAANASLDAPWSDVARTNIGGTYNVFEAARQAGCGRVIFASSNHVVGGYERDGSPRQAPISVDAPPRPDSLYAVGKLFGETLGRYYSDAFGLHVSCIRIGSMNDADSPIPRRSRLPWRRDPAAERRLGATWFSHRDFARLVRAILEGDVPFAIVYGVGDNAERFWDIDPGRIAYDFWPADGVR
ncbi:MAG: hypothetical protein NVS2B3_16940 [Vulcanimicrobiaceae bacterium]